jgi:hypothetical protein
MSQIYRFFIRHENDAQPTWFKVRSEKSQGELIQDLQNAMNSPAPSLWQCVDLEQRRWIFRADKIYTACVYAAEEEGAKSEHLQIAPH